MLPMLPLFLISSTHLHLLSPRMLRPSVRCRILDMDPVRFWVGSIWCPQGGWRMSRLYLCQRQCTLSLSLYPPLQFFPIFFRTHFCQVYFLRLFRFPSVCATLCVLSFPICCARCLIFLLSASHSRFVVKFCHGVSIEVLINIQYLCIHTLHTHRHIYAVYVCMWGAIVMTKTFRCS